MSKYHITNSICADFDEFTDKVKLAAQIFVFLLV